MNYVLFCICFVLQINLLYSAETFYKEFLTDNPDFTLINKYPDYLTLVTKVIKLNYKLRKCIKKSNNIGEDFKKKIDSITELELNENLLYYNNKNLTLDQIRINTRIKFCVLSEAFVPCVYNPNTSSSSNSTSPLSLTPSNSSSPLSLSFSNSSSPLNSSFSNSSSPLNSSVSSSGSSTSSSSGCKTNCKTLLTGSNVNAEVMRRLAAENDDCQTCDDENLTGCLIIYLGNNQRKKVANDIDKYYCYSTLQKEKNCTDKNDSTWKELIYNLIEEDNSSILSCLVTHHCCAAFNYDNEETGLEIEISNRTNYFG